MNSVRVSTTVFVLLFGGSLLGMYVSTFLPADMLRGETRNQVQIEVGLLTSMFALLLSLQLSSGKNTYDMQERNIALLASKTMMLDRVLVYYGPDAGDARKALKDATVDLLNHVWPSETSVAPSWAPTGFGEHLYRAIEALTPKDERQSSQRVVALGMMIDIGQQRWLSAQVTASATERSLRIVEIIWATIIFMSYGLLAPRVVPIVISLGVCAAAVSVGFFLIVELNRPFNGRLRASSAPIQEALKYLDQ